MALLNTHTTVKKFIKHGFSEDQAEVIVEAINDHNTQLVTKNDLNIAIARLESKIDTNTVDINWIKSISIGTFLMLLGSIVTIMIKQLL